MSDTAFAARNPIQHSRFTSRAVPLAVSAWTLLREWQRRRRSRAELASYSFAARSDFGYSAELDDEIAKPFWKK